MEKRTYERTGTQVLESITVHVSDNGYIRMTADNLHDVLDYLGFVEIKTKEKDR